MTIQQCKYVLEISKTGSFNEASKRLFIAQSSLSASIRSLEKEFGIEIFTRTRNGVCLTEEGAEFVRYAEQMVEHNNFIENRYRANTNRKKLHIVTQHYDFVADIFCGLLRETEDDKFYFSLRETKTYEVIKEIETASSDIGIIAIKDNDLDLMTRFLGSKNIDFIPVLNAKPHVFIRSGHVLCSRKKIKAEDLIKFPYVSYEQGSHSSTFFTEEIFNGNEVKKHVEISDRATLMNVLLTTDCYTVGTGIMPSALNDGKILSIPFETERFYYLGYITNKTCKNMPTVEKFIGQLKSFAEKIENKLPN